MKPSRIVVVSTMVPVPFALPPLGRWSYVLLKGLVARGHRVTMIVPCQHPEQQEAARALFPPPVFDLRTHLVPRTPGLLDKWRTLRQPNSHMFGPELRRDLAGVLSEPWDILHLEDIWSGWLGLRHDRRKTLLNVHNLYRIDDLGVKEPRVKEDLMRRLRRAAEARLARAYPNLMTLSDRLALELRALSPRSAVRICPLGLPLELYPFIPAGHRPEAPVVSLIGSMGWNPTLSAARRLLTRLWPAVKARVPQARCHVAGSGASLLLRRFAGMPDVKIEDNIPDSRAFFESAGVLLYAPGAGSGMKLKVMEAFAFGVPVVTTAEGVEGLPAVDGTHAGVCEDDAGLVERTVSLLQDKALRERRRAAARALIESCCGQEAVMTRLESVYAEVQSAS